MSLGTGDYQYYRALLGFSELLRSWRAEMWRISAAGISPTMIYFDGANHNGYANGDEVLEALFNAGFRVLMQGTKDVSDERNVNYVNLF